MYHTCRMCFLGHYKTTSCWYCSRPHRLDHESHSNYKEQNKIITKIKTMIRKVLLFCLIYYNIQCIYQEPD